MKNDTVPFTRTIYVRRPPLLYYSTREIREANRESLNTFGQKCLDRIRKLRDSKYLDIEA